MVLAASLGVLLLLLFLLPFHSGLLQLLLREFNIHLDRGVTSFVTTLTNDATRTVWIVKTVTVVTVTLNAVFEFLGIFL